MVAFALPGCVCFVWNQAGGRSLPQGQGWEGMCGGVCKARQEAPLTAGRPGTQDALAERGEVGPRGPWTEAKGRWLWGGTLEHPSTSPRSTCAVAPVPGAQKPSTVCSRSPALSPLRPALPAPPHNTPILTRVFLSCLSPVPVPSPLLPVSRLWSP